MQKLNPCYQLFVFAISFCSFVFSGYETIHIIVNRNITEVLSMHINTEDVFLLNTNIILVISLLSIFQTISYIVLFRKFLRIRIASDESSYNQFN